MGFAGGLKEQTVLQFICSALVKKVSQSGQTKDMKTGDTETCMVEKNREEELVPKQEQTCILS